MAKKKQTKQKQKQSQNVSQKVIINLGEKKGKKKTKRQSTIKQTKQEIIQQPQIIRSNIIQPPNIPFPMMPQSANIPNQLANSIANGINAILAKMPGQQTATMNFTNPQNRLFAEIPRAGLDPNIRPEDQIVNIGGRMVEEPEFDNADPYEEQNRIRIQLEEGALRRLEKQKQRTLNQLEDERIRILEEMNEEYSRSIYRLRNPFPSREAQLNLLSPAKPSFIQKPLIYNPEIEKMERDREQERLEKEAEEEEIRSQKSQASLEEIKQQLGLEQPEEGEEEEEPKKKIIPIKRKLVEVKYQSSNGIVHTKQVRKDNLNDEIEKIINFNESGKPRLRKIDSENIYVDGKKWKEL